MFVGFVLKSAVTQAGPADTGLSGPSISVFGTIHPDIFRLRAPLGSGHPGERIRLASLGPQFQFDVPGRRRHADRRVRIGVRDASATASLDERFAAFDDRPASFDKRFASAADCPASFDESLAAAMQALASSLRLPWIGTQRADARPKATVAKARVRPAQARKELPPLDDDGRTAIYDITARVVYLPGGRRLEAHSGLGGFMDSPAMCI